MQERLKEIPKKFLEYWNKWTSKQKTIIISAILAVIVLVAVLVAVLGRTRYAELSKFEDTKTASQVVSLLKENAIETKLASDNLTVMVDEEKYMDAVMAVSVSDMVGDDFGIDDVLNNSLTTTNSERLIKNHYYVSSDIEEYIEKYTPGVIDAQVKYIPVDTSNSILSANKSITVSVWLAVNEFFNEKSAAGIATGVAAAVGNKNTDDIRVVNQDGDVLFNGPEPVNEYEIDLEDTMAISEQMRKLYIEQVTGAMLMNNFTEVNVAPYLDIDFNNVKELFTEYFPLEGEIHGVLTEDHQSSGEGTNGYGDIPGTDSNDETDYFITNGTDGNYEFKTVDRFYESSSKITETLYANGTVNVDTSRISVTARRVIDVTEEDLEIKGALEDVTFEEYRLNNEGAHQTETKQELITLISNATGIPEENITLITYDVYQFTAKQEVAKDWTFYLQILLAVILIAFLLFVVFRGMAPVEVTELEPELSVEQLLATTKENQSLEDVEFSEQSETRKMIEKFFEENPEAVAQLLRNWLNEDWD